MNANVLEWGLSGEVDPRPCFFLGMELLDNLPHDKIAWTTPSFGADGDTIFSSPERSDNEELCESVVVQTPSGFREAFRPLRDPVIRELLTHCPELASMVNNLYDSSSSPRLANDVEKRSASFLGNTLSLFGNSDLRPEHRAAFVPTGSLRLVQALRKRLPRHRAILADFDSFAGSAGGIGAESAGGVAAAGGGRENDESLTAFYAPIVSSRDPVSGAVTDHATYMVPLGSADIFFPTCFKRLSRLHAAVCSKGGVGGCATGSGGLIRGRGLVVKQAEFLREFADLTATRTFSGFNPLVDDFRNSSMFLSGAVAQ